jgi:hypothetical protein
MTVKQFFIISAKQAVNVLLLDTGLYVGFPDVFPLANLKGIEHIGYAALLAIGTREVAVWMPVLLKWSNTNATPDELQARLDVAQGNMQAAVKSNLKAQAAISDAKDIVAPKQD